MEKDDKRWIKPKEAAAYLSINLKTVYRLLYARGLPGVKLQGIGWRIDRKRLDNWMEGQMDEREQRWRRITSWR
jgi:excisionase family DNA binding protein